LTNPSTVGYFNPLAVKLVRIRKVSAEDAVAAYEELTAFSTYEAVEANEALTAFNV
jgi:hypothetical protein